MKFSNDFVRFYRKGESRIYKVNLLLINGDKIC